MDDSSIERMRGLLGQGKKRLRCDLDRQVLDELEDMRHYQALYFNNSFILFGPLYSTTIRSCPPKLETIFNASEGGEVEFLRPTVELRVPR